MNHTLLVSEKQKPQRRYSLTDDVLVIGRDTGNEICLPDLLVSRKHCRVRFEQGRVVLEDLESSNGTFVNGVLVNRCELQPGDRILVGDSEITFDCQTPVATDETLPANSLTVDAEATNSAKNLGTAKNLDRLADPELLPMASRLEESSSYYQATGEAVEVGRKFVQVANDLRFVYHASMATSRTRDLHQMLDEILKLVFDWISADRGCVFYCQPDTDTFEVESFQCRANFGDHEFRVSKSIVNYVREQGVGVLSTHAAQDRRWGAQPSILKLKIGEVMCVPIQGRDRLLGLIYLDTLVSAEGDEPARFNEDSLKLLIAIAHQTAVAIENETYYRTLLEKERLAAIGETTAVIAHHIKNVLQAINGGAHLVESGLKDDKPKIIRQGWQVVARNQNQISRLVSDMLLLGGPYSPHREMADMEALIQSVLLKRRPDFKKVSASCDLHISATLREFRFDKRGMTSVLSNILGLSLLACQETEEPIIDLQIGLKNGKVIIAITDQGRSLQISETNEILDPLGFGDRHKIQGIGLAVARKIVEGHGGEITIAHPAGQGNRFVIKLPID